MMLFWTKVLQASAVLEVSQTKFFVSSTAYA